MTEFEPFPKVPRLSREMVITEKLDGTNAQVFIREAEVDDFRLNAEMNWPVIVAQEALPPMAIYAGSRKRWIRPNAGKALQTDNFGFASWVYDNAQELVKLGPGTHYGEWWGQGIQRGYGLTEKRFSLFNVGRWRSIHDHPGKSDPICQYAGPGVPVKAACCSETCAYEDHTHFIGRTVAPHCCHVVPVLFRGTFGAGLSGLVMHHLSVSGSIAAPGFMNPEGIMIYHTAARQMFKKTFDGDAEGKERVSI